MEDLADLNLREALAAAAFFLPKRIRRRLKVIGRVSAPSLTLRNTGLRPAQRLRFIHGDHNPL